MKEDNLEKLENLLLADDGLLILLRLGDGLDENKVKRICEVLKELNYEWRSLDYIPKKAADIFVDFYFVMESSYGLYNEDEVEKIIQAADEIMALIRACIVSR